MNVKIPNPPIWIKNIKIVCPTIVSSVEIFKTVIHLSFVGRIVLVHLIDRSLIVTHFVLFFCCFLSFSITFSLLYSGWKVFTLDYSVANTPLSAIITNKAMANYLQIFRFLWRIKRVESSLSSLWQRTMNTRGLLRRDVPELFGIMHKCSLLRNEMQHVTTILLSYMMYVNYFVPSQ